MSSTLFIHRIKTVSTIIISEKFAGSFLEQSSSIRPVWFNKLEISFLFLLQD